MHLGGGRGPRLFFSCAFFSVDPFKATLQLQTPSLPPSSSRLAVPPPLPLLGSAPSSFSPSCDLSFPAPRPDRHWSFALLTSPFPLERSRADTGLACVLAATFLLSSRFSYGRSWSLSELSSDEMSLWRLKGNREEGGFHFVCVFPSLASPHVTSFSRQNSRARETRLHSIQIAVPCF